MIQNTEIQTQEMLQNEEIWRWRNRKVISFNSMHQRGRNWLQRTLSCKPPTKLSSQLNLKLKILVVVPACCLPHPRSGLSVGKKKTMDSRQIYWRQEFLMATQIGPVTWLAGNILNLQIFQKYFNLVTLYQATVDRDKCQVLLEMFYLFWSQSAGEETLNCAVFSLLGLKTIIRLRRLLSHSSLPPSPSLVSLSKAASLS